MWWQTAIVLALVGGSVALLARSAYRSLTGRGSCSAGCGKCSEARGNAKRLASGPVDFRNQFQKPDGK